MWGKTRVIPSNEHMVTGMVCGPDAFAEQAASLGLATNTSSPMSYGVGTRTFGLAGYGVNRWAGRTLYQQGNLQDFLQPSAPVRKPLSKRLGIGAGVSGQPGFPSTGDNALGIATLDLGDGPYTGIMPNLAGS